MYLIVLSTSPPAQKKKKKGKEIKGEPRCLCLDNKAEAACYGQTLEGWQVGEGAAGCEGTIIQAPIKNKKVFLILLLVLSATEGHGVLPSSSPLGRSVATRTGSKGQRASWRSRDIQCTPSSLQDCLLNYSLWPIYCFPRCFAVASFTHSHFIHRPVGFSVLPSGFGTASPLIVSLQRIPPSGATSAPIHCIFSLKH